jgi:hypothetical protein
VKPSSQNYSDNSLWKQVSWSAALLETAYRNAYDGKFVEASDLHSAMLRNQRLSAVYQVRLKGVLGLPLTFKDDPERAKPSAIAEQLGRDFWDMAPESALYQLMLWGHNMGVGLAELRWTKGERWLPTIRVYNPRNLKYNFVLERWELSTKTQTVYPVNGDGKWWIYTPYGDHRGWMNAPWTSLAVPWLLAYDATFAWGRDNEVGAIRVGKAAEGAGNRRLQDPDFPSDPTKTKTELELFIASIRDLGKKTAVGLPFGWDLEIISPPESVFKSRQAAIEWAEKSMSIGVLGQNLTTDVTGGSFSAARVHNEVKADIIQADTEYLATSTRLGLIAPVVKVNYGDNTPIPWPEWESQPPADEVATAESTLKKLEVIEKARGLGFDTSKLEAEMGFERAQSEPVGGGNNGQV